MLITSLQYSQTPVTYPRDKSKAVFGKLGIISEAKCNVQEGANENGRRSFKINYDFPKTSRGMKRIFDASAGAPVIYIPRGVSRARQFNVLTPAKLLLECMGDMSLNPFFRKLISLDRDTAFAAREALRRITTLKLKDNSRLAWQDRTHHFLWKGITVFHQNDGESSRLAGPEPKTKIMVPSMLTLPIELTPDTKRDRRLLRRIIEKQQAAFRALQQHGVVNSMDGEVVPLAYNDIHALAAGCMQFDNNGDIYLGSVTRPAVPADSPAYMPVRDYGNALINLAAKAIKQKVPQLWLPYNKFQEQL